MTTKLGGPDTVFLPFNKGSDPGGKNCGKGNPVPNGPGYPTDYLWQEVWERESWLEILGRYCIAERNKKKQITRVLFPRYHQLVVTRLLQEAVRNEGPGSKYLIQHSAGSGKTNSIAWTAHFFSELHDANDQKVFDSVLVVSDRNVIDSQLQEALESFERKKGVVASITTEKGIKSDQLATALGGDKKVVVCTIQTFPALLAAIIDKLNDLFTGELSDEDKVIYMRSVIRSKLLESPTLQQQASANSKEQFGSSPDLGSALMDAIISALDAHQTMSSQALGSPTIRDGMKEILLGQTGLYEELRERAAAA